MAKKKKKKKKLHAKKRGVTGMKRIAIVGKGEGRGLAPRSPHPTTEVWGTNNVALQQPVDVIFDMHNLDWTMEENIRNYDHLDITEEEKKDRAELRDIGFRKLKEYAKETGTTIISLNEYEGIPSKKYPLEQIIEKFDCDMFSSVTPYMIAYAIYIGATHIDLYGINCAWGEEWAYQREAVTGWLMFAKGMGIKVSVNGGKHRPMRLQMEYLYGYNIPQRERGIKTVDSWMEPPEHAKYKAKEHDPNDLVRKTFTVWKEA